MTKLFRSANTNVSNSWLVTKLFSSANTNVPDPSIHLTTKLPIRITIQLISISMDEERKVIILSEAVLIGNQILADLKITVTTKLETPVKERTVTIIKRKR